VSGGADDLHAGIASAGVRQWHEDSAQVTPANLMFPLFVTDEPSSVGVSAIGALPEMHHVPAADIVAYVEPLVANGLHSVLVFGVLKTPANVARKCNRALVALDDASPVVVAVRLLKARFPTLLVAVDVCLCAYTDHGHCCVFAPSSAAAAADAARLMDHAESPLAIARVAVHYARAGADIVAPSDMMDGRIRAIKLALAAARLSNTVAVMSYSAKFASALYGPFRAAANSAPSFGDRKCYQLPPGARQLALRAVRRDLAEGADFVMVKPAGMYLDVIRETANISSVPVACYQVSGEYAMIHAAAAAGCLDLEAAMLESVRALRRAGATILITYFTPRLLAWYKKQQQQQR
jgi:porphobilinogen synthase